MANQTYQTIYAELKKRILDGTYRVKMRLPIEDELINEFNASRYAVRKAISVLVEEGLVYSVKGRGVVILENNNAQSDEFNLSLGQAEGLQALNEHRSLTYATTVISCDLKLVDHTIQDKTGFANGLPVYEVIRLRKVNGKNAVLDISYFNAQIVVNLTKEIAQQSIYNYLQERLGVKIAIIKRQLKIESTTALDDQYLDLELNNCIGNMISIGVNDSGKHFEYTESHFIPGQFAFTQLIKY
ncbi:GntR family transcriptional regulator [Latilactobacillus curvatus]|uniref:GntR family transcriptional regulator n=1 Tax=Latilactobacillus curvatus TaxID=28038 RepID=UPI00084A0114|nr:GntR family transcriptional regulator [Latilactobacillus curvatus]AOO75457.1 GntR family transcriptional regulator [Latilactobacillus curvatus]